MLKPIVVRQFSNYPFPTSTDDSGREVQYICTSIELFHHMLATASFGVLRGMGNSHVMGCSCKTCK